MEKSQLKSIILLMVILLMGKGVQAQQAESLLWFAGATDRIYGSPVIFGDKIFVGSIDGRLHCIDRETGRKYYQVDMEGIINSTPIVYQQTIIFVAGNDLVCFDPEAIEEVWRYSSGSNDDPEQFDEWDYHHSSPVLHDGQIYLGSATGFLLAINPETGQLITSWATTNNAPIRTPPSFDGNTVYFGDWAGKIYALDLQSSSYLWAVNTYTGQSYENYAGILSHIEIGENLIYYGARNHIIKALRKSNGQTAWAYTSPDGGWISGDPVLFDDLLLVGGSDNHKLLCFNAANGTLVWDYTYPGNCFSRPLLTDDKIILTTGNAYANTGQNYGKGFVHVLNLPGGEVFQEVELPGNSFSSPVEHEGVVYVGCDDKNLYAFDGLKLAGIVGSSVVDNWNNKIDQTKLKAFPNPFSEKLHFSFELIEAGEVSIKILDLTGRSIDHILIQPLPSGQHVIATRIPSVSPNGMILAQLLRNNKPISCIRLYRSQ